MRIFFVRALDSKSFVFTQTKRRNLRLRVLFRDIRHVYFGTYLQIRNPRLVSIHYFCGKGREVNLKIIFFKLRSGHDWRSSMRSDAGPGASGAGPTDCSRGRPSRPVPVPELTIFLHTYLHQATVTSTCIYTAMFH